LLLCLLILLLGFVTQTLLVQSAIAGLHKAMGRIPFVKTIYKISVDIFSALFSADGKQAFKQPVMIPFPAPPNFSLGLVCGEVAEEIQSKIDRPLIAVFMPTAPHPISGFLFLVPQNEVCFPDMSKEEVVKFLVSCGTI